MAKLRVAVIFGGQSGEHEVSIISGGSVINALDKNKYEILPVYINKDGQWLLDKDVKELVSGKDHDLVYLPSDPTNKSLVPVQMGNGQGEKIDVVFPVLHGTLGEDGSIQGLLELTNLPYVGAGVLGSALGMDKALMKKVFQAEKLPIVNYLVFLSKEIGEKVIDQIEKEFNYPLFIKPANLGSSVGITKAHNKKELEQGLKLASSYDRKIVVEEAVKSAREIEIAVLGNDEPIASIAGEVVPSNEFYDYNAKYIDDNSELIIPAQLTTQQLEELQSLSTKAFKALDLKGMARVDFLVEKESGKIYLNEVNTIPGFTSISMYPKLWEASRLKYSALLDKLIDYAMKSHQEKQKLTRNFDSKLLK